MADGWRPGASADFQGFADPLAPRRVPIDLASVGPGFRQEVISEVGEFGVRSGVRSKLPDGEAATFVAWPPILRQSATTRTRIRFLFFPLGGGKRSFLRGYIIILFAHRERAREGRVRRNVGATIRQRRRNDFGTILQRFRCAFVALSLTTCAAPLCPGTRTARFRLALVKHLHDSGDRGVWYANRAQPRYRGLESHCDNPSAVSRSPATARSISSTSARSDGRISISAEIFR